jgi:hypothetical protein
MDCEPLQRSQLGWIQRLLSRPVRRAAGLEPGRFLGTDDGAEGLDRGEFFRRSGLAFDPGARFLPFLPEELSEASLAMLSPHLSADSLLIGYELAEPTRRVLARLGVPFIDFWLHPVRFLDDLLFGFYASDPASHRELPAFAIDPEVFWLYADRIRTAFHARGQVPDLVPGSALFVGQTLRDKAVLRHTRMLNVLDYQDAFTDLCRAHPRVYYSRHPHLGAGDEAILQFLGGIGNVELCPHPAYQLLASDRITRVMTVSSSVGIEAQYFDLPSDILYQPVINLGTRHECQEYVAIFQEWLSPHFWSRILGPVLPTRPCGRVAFLDPGNKLRDMLDWQFSNRFLDKAEGQREQLRDLSRQVADLDLRQSFRDLLARAARRGGRDLVVCGAGRAGRAAVAEAHALGLHPVAVSDRNPALHGSAIDGVPVLPLDAALGAANTYVIGSTEFQREIRAEVETRAKALGLGNFLLFSLAGDNVQPSESPAS